MNNTNHLPTTNKGRKNGLDRPWGYAQMGAWITYGISILQYIIFVTPLLSPCITSPILSILFYTSTLYVFLYASYTILINPIDIHLHQYRTLNEIQQQQQQTTCTNDDHENGTDGVTNGTSALKKKKAKDDHHQPIIIRNPLYQPPLSRCMNYETTSRKQKNQPMSLSDRLYYRTNAKQLQLYNNSSLYHQHQCRNNNNNINQHSSAQQPESQQQQLLHASLPNENMKQCWICDASVAEHSMHCKFCNKCVYGFDHHCIWLNTCIGRANYVSFFRTLQSLFIMEILHLISHLILICTFFQNTNELKDRIRYIYPFMSVYVPFVIWILFLIFNCMALMLLGQLYIFHSMLQKKNLTTYEHIVQDYRNQRSITRRLNDMEAERAESIIRAQSQKKTLTVLQLKIGKFCRERGISYFDIMRIPPEPDEPDPEAGFAYIFGKNVGPDEEEEEQVNLEHNNDNIQDNYGGDSNYAAEMADYDIHDVIHLGESGEDNEYNEDNDNNNTLSIKDSKYDDDEDDDDDEKNQTLYDVDESIRSNTTRSVLTSTSHKNKEKNANEVMDDDDEQQQQQQPNYVELTMSGQNDYCNETEGRVIIDASGDQDGEESDVAGGGLDASTSQYYEEDEDEDAVDGIFIDDPDDMSHKSGCSGRSYRSGRSGKSGRSSKTGSKLTERDLTAF